MMGGMCRGIFLFFGLRWLMCVVVLGLRVAVDSSDIACYQSRSIWGFVCYSVCGYFAFGGPINVTCVIIFLYPFIL